MASSRPSVARTQGGLIAELCVRLRTKPRAASAAASAVAVATGLLLFAPPALAANQTLKVKVTGPGSVTGSGIECGHGATTCETEVEEGAPLTLTASPTERGIFKQWTDCETTNGTECTLTLTAATEVKAEFEPIPQEQLTVNVTEGTGAGTVTGTSTGPESPPIECIEGSGTCAAPYNQGTAIILFATPAQGSAFTTWTGCTTVLGPTECEVALTEAKTVKAEFDALPGATLNPVSGIGAVSATLSATLQPRGGGNITSCVFEYIDEFEFRLDASQTFNPGGNLWNGAQQAPCETNPVSQPPYAGSTETDVSASLASLSPGSDYHYRLVISNSSGPSTLVGPEFTTVGRYSPSTDIGSPGSAAGQLTEPSDVAVNDSTGDLYVADTGNHRVDQFSSAGAFLRAWGWGVENGEEVPQVCTSPCQAGLPAANYRSSGAGQLTAPTFLAVDNSSSPSHGDVYVAENVPAQPAVNQVQQLTITGATGGSFALSFKGHTTTATVVGDTTKGSNEITNLASASSPPLVGEKISGPGIPPGATLTEKGFLGIGVYTLILSAPATETSTAVTVSASVPHDASANLLQEALRSAAASVQVEGPEGGPYAIEFTEGNGADQPQIEAEPAGLTPPGASMEVTEVRSAIPAVPFLSRVQKFSPEGALITGWGTDGAADFTSVGAIDGVAVDNLGNLFVASSTDWTEFSPDGTHQTKIPTESGAHSLATSNGQGIDIGPSGNFYQSSPIGVSIAPPDTSFGYDSFEIITGPGSPTGLAVNHSTGDLFVDHGTFVYQFPTSAGCIAAGGSTCPPSDLIGEGELTDATGLALDPSTEVLYAADPGAGDIAAFAPLSLPILTTELAAVHGPTTAILRGQVEPGQATEVQNCRFEYTTEAQFLPHGFTAAPTAPCSPATATARTAVSAEISGLTPFTTYHYRLAATAPGEHGYPTYGRDLTVTPRPGLPPTIDTTTSSAVTPTTATLNAEINPNSSSTIYRFRYGTTAAYGSQNPPSESIGETSSDVGVSDEISGLTPGTSYHFQAVATNLSGVTEGPDQTFSTPALPAISETSASNIGPTTATLGALLRPGFLPTTYRFEYGTGSAYGQTTPQSASIGSDNSSHQATADLTGLAPVTTYHFRVLATNEVGTTPSPDQTFTTAPEGEKKVTPSPTCKKGHVLKRGKCVKTTHHKPKRHHRGGKK